MPRLESRCRRSVGVEQLIPDFVRGKPALRSVVVRLVPGVDHDANAPADQQPVLHERRLGVPRVVVDADPVERNRRRDGVFEQHRVEEQRIVLLAGPPHLQVHVVEPVHRPDLLAGGKSGSAFHAQAYQLPAVVGGLETHRVEERAGGAAGADVDIGEIADAQPLVERADAVVRERVRDDAIAHGVNARPLLDTNVDATVESLSVGSTYLTEAPCHLVRAGERRHRPQEWHPAEGVCIELRANGRRRRWPQRELRGGGHQSHERVDTVVKQVFGRRRTLQDEDHRLEPLDQLHRIRRFTRIQRSVS